MRRMKCKCGSEHFKVHPKAGVLQCWRCNQRYEAKLKCKPSEIPYSADIPFFVSWKEVNFSKPRQIVNAVKEAISVPIEWAQDRVIHPKKEKGGLVSTPEHNLLHPDPFLLAEEIERTKSQSIENRIRHRWNSELKLLGMQEQLYFQNNVHKGKVRGKDIARLCHRDLQRIGIKTRLSFDDGGGIVEAVA